MALVTSDGSLEESAYRIHPALLDAAFQLLFVAAPAGSTQLFLPVRLDELRSYGVARAPFWAHARVREATDNLVVGDVAIYDDSGAAIADVRSLRCRPVEAARRQTGETLDDWLYEQVWRECSAPVRFGRTAAPPVFTTAAIEGLAGLEGKVHALAGSARFETYYAVEPLLNDAALTYLVEALCVLGDPDGAGVVNRAAIDRRVAPARRRLLERATEALEKAGRLIAGAESWTVVPSAAASPEALIAEYPATRTKRACWPGQGRTSRAT